MRCLCSFGGCVCVPGAEPSGSGIFPWQLLLLLAEGFPLIHCDQLKCPHFSLWIWGVFADSLGAADYKNEIFNILAFFLNWDLFRSFWAEQGEIFAVQFIFWNVSSGTIFLAQTNVVADSLCPLVCYSHPSAHPLSVWNCLLCSPGQFSKPDHWNWFVWLVLFVFGFVFFFEITHFSMLALSAKISPAIR